LHDAKKLKRHAESDQTLPIPAGSGPQRSFSPKGHLFSTFLLIFSMLVGIHMKEALEGYRPSTMSTAFSKPFERLFHALRKGVTQCRWLIRLRGRRQINQPFA